MSIDYKFNNESISRVVVDINKHKEVTVKAINKYLYNKYGDYGRENIIMNHYINSGKIEWVLDYDSEKSRVVAILRTTLDCNTWNMEYWCDGATPKELRDLMYVDLK